MRKRPMNDIGNDPIAEARLDEALNDAGQQFIALGVKRLESEAPSMAWRSQLNEAIRAEAQKFERKRKFVWTMRPLAGAAAATALVVAFWSPTRLQTPLDAPAPGRTEASLLQAHQVAERNFELTGSALSARETDVRQISNAVEWEPTDLGAL